MVIIIISRREKVGISPVEVIWEVAMAFDLRTGKKAVWRGNFYWVSPDLQYRYLLLQDQRLKTPRWLLLEAKALYSRHLFLAVLMILKRTRTNNVYNFTYKQSYTSDNLKTVTKHDIRGALHTRRNFFIMPFV